MLKGAGYQRRNEKLPVAACSVCDQQVVINSQEKGATLEKSYQTRALRRTPGVPVGLWYFTAGLQHINNHTAFKVALKSVFSKGDEFFRINSF